MTSARPRFFYALIAGEGILFCAALLWMGPSANQLLTALQFGLGVILVLAAGGLLIRSLAQPDRADPLISLLDSEKAFFPVLGLSLLALLESVQDLIYLQSGFYKPHLVQEYYQNYLSPLEPTLWLGAVISLQILAALFVISPLRERLKTLSQRDMIRNLLVFVFLLGLWLVLAFTDWGYIQGTADEELRARVGRFLPLTNPLTGLQVLLSGLFALGAAAAGHVLRTRFQALGRILTHPLLIGTLIWLMAWLIWSSIPIEPSYLIDFPAVPGKVIYPNSDGFYFAKEAQQFLAGGGFEKDTTHVLYSLFLGLLMAVGGDDYPLVIQLQQAVLALAPVLLFWMGRKIHSPLAGLVAAILFILREQNGLLLGEELAGPISSTFLSENLAVVGLIAFFYLVYSWAEDPEKRYRQAWIAGGLLGCLLLIRADFLAIFLAAGAAGLFLLWDQRWAWLKGMAGMGTVMIIITVPWMVRNWQNTGVFYLDKGTIIQRRLAAYYEQLFEGETSVKEKLITRSGEYDFYTGRVGSMLNHLGSNLHQSLLYLPNSHHPGGGLGNYLVYAANLAGNGNLRYDWQEYAEMDLNAYTRREPYYWFEWDGKTRPGAILPVSLTILLVTLGWDYSWRERKKSGLLFLLAWLAHCLIWAFVGFSGNRFIKTIDWVTLLFLGLGIAEFLRIITDARGGSNQKGSPVWLLPSSDQAFRPRPRLELAALGILVLIGLSPTVLEVILPSHYPEAGVELSTILRDEQLEMISPAAASCLEGAVSNGGEIFSGRAIYPRYYAAGEILGNDRRGIPLDPSFPKINFYLVGAENTGVTLPDATQDQIFPHGQDVLAGGKLINGRYIKAGCLVLLEGEAQVGRVIYDANIE